MTPDCTRTRNTENKRAQRERMREFLAQFDRYNTKKEKYEPITDAETFVRTLARTLTQRQIATLIEWMKGN
jgi:hypothetical protein